MRGALAQRLRCALALLLLALGACASHHQVKCDSKLEPINSPHPKPHPETLR